MTEESPVLRTLSKIANADAGRQRKHIVIFGAGIAGLVAAYELSKLGHNVTIYEASKRVGGRAWTHKFPSGAYHELGAMRIPKTHLYTHHYIEHVCGLSTRPFINHHSRSERFYRLRGITTSHSEAKTRLLSNYKLSQRELDFLSEADTPIVALMAPLGSLADEIGRSEEDRAALFLRGPTTEKIQRLEKMTLGEFMREAWDTEDAVELVGCVTGLEVWWDKAVTMFLRDAILEDGAELVEIVGGTSNLPDSLLPLVKSQGVQVLLDRPVTEIHARENDIQFVVGRGRNAALLDAEFGICTIPFPVLRRVTVSGFSQQKLRAIRNLTYASSTKVLLDCPDRFWEADGVVGGGSQTDLINRQIYYPSDGHPAEEPSLEQAQPVQGMSHRKNALLSAPRPPRAGALVASYVWGADSRRLAAMDEKERIQVARQCVGSIHPEILQPNAVTAGRSMAWDHYQWSGGAFCFARPGDMPLYYAAARRPEGHLFFAGEHCSLTQGWLQGAIESALDSVLELARL